MPAIGIGENSEKSKILRPGLNRPFEMGIDRRRIVEKTRSGKTPDGKGVKIVENPEVTVGWPDLLEDED